MRYLSLVVALVMMVALASAQKECLKPCGRNFALICGKFADGTVKTFSNPCVMGIEACEKGQSVTVLYSGECKK